MKKRIFLMAAVAVLSSALLAACSSGGKNANQPVTYTYVFSSDPATLDYTVSGLWRSLFSLPRYLTKHFTCYDGVQENISDGIYRKETVVVDGNLTTSRGPSTALSLTPS